MNRLTSDELHAIAEKRGTVVCFTCLVEHRRGQCLTPQEQEERLRECVVEARRELSQREEAAHG